MTSSDAVADAQDAKQRGDAAFRAGDHAAAAAAFTAGLASAPPHQPLHKTLATNLSAAHERRGDFAAALQAADAAVAAAPLWSRAHLRRGRALIGLKHFTAAAEALEHSLALSPGDAGAQQALYLARELAAQRASAVPVSLAASKWPGGDAADGDDGGSGTTASAARRDGPQDPAAAAQPQLGNGTANGEHTAAGRPARPRVTVLSGFLGAGKTTLLSHILASVQGLRIAVIVNDMAQFNIDASLLRDAEAFRKAEPRLVELTNGCICCSLRADLIEEVSALASTGRFDHIVVESTGIGEPLPVAAAFAAVAPGGQMLADVAQLDTMVTVVDAAEFLPMLRGAQLRFAAAEPIARCQPGDMHATDPAPLSRLHVDQAAASVSTMPGSKMAPPPATAQDTAPAPVAAPAASQAATGDLSQLLVDQVEFADVILLNKCDLASEQQLQQTEAVIRQLNPTARVLRCERCRVGVSDVLGTGRFNIAAAAATSGWQQEVAGSHAPESEEFGISSFVWTDQHITDLRRRCFHPGRLWTALHKTAPDGSGSSGGGNSAVRHCGSGAGCGNGKLEAVPPLAGCLRSKGYFRLAHEPRLCWQWSTAGSSLAFTPAGDWAPCNSGVAEADRAAEQVLVFIGVSLDKEAIARSLEACLLTQDEAARQRSAADWEPDSALWQHAN